MIGGSRAAGEFLAELEDKPEHRERQRLLQLRREENARRYGEAATGVLADLAEAGFPVASVAEVGRRGVGTRRAVPVLAKWLPRVQYPPLKRDIIGALGSPWGRPSAARPLLDEFDRVNLDNDPPGGLRWSIGDALERVADESVLDNIVEIARDRRHGQGRSLVVAALGNMKGDRERVVPILLELLRDPDVAPYAIMGLGKLRAPEARSAIEPFRRHSEAWVRTEAKRALARLPG